MGRQMLVPGISMEVFFAQTKFLDKEQTLLYGAGPGRDGRLAQADATGLV